MDFDFRQGGLQETEEEAFEEYEKSFSKLLEVVSREEIIGVKNEE